MDKLWIGHFEWEEKEVGTDEKITRKVQSECTRGCLLDNDLESLELQNWPNTMFIRFVD